MRILLFLHLIGVSFWLGGQLLFVVVLAPALRSMPDFERREIFARVGRRYGIASVPALMLILATGALMAAKYNLDVAESLALQRKLGAVAVVLAATAIHAVAAARSQVRVSRISAGIGLAATIAAVWFATRL
jgi:uncharacterized membrane protein